MMLGGGLMIIFGLLMMMLVIGLPVLLVIVLVTGGVGLLRNSNPQPTSLPPSAAAGITPVAQPPQPTASSVRFCTHCGAGLQAGWTHCPQCGAPAGV